VVIAYVLNREVIVHFNAAENQAPERIQPPGADPDDAIEFLFTPIAHINTPDEMNGNIINELQGSRDIGHYDAIQRVHVEDQVKAAITIAAKRVPAKNKGKKRAAAKLVDTTSTKEATTPTAATPSIAKRRKQAPSEPSMIANPTPVPAEDMMPHAEPPFVPSLGAAVLAVVACFACASTVFTDEGRLKKIKCRECQRVSHKQVKCSQNAARGNDPWVCLECRAKNSPRRRRRRHRDEEEQQSPRSRRRGLDDQDK
jgi:hypothetical protein